MPEEKNNNLLIAALVSAQVTHDYKPLLKYLDNGGNIDEKVGLGTALINAAYDGDLTLISLLKEKGSDIEAKGNYGGTPLLWAASDGQLSAVQLLLTLGADIDALGDGEATALHWCSGFYPAGLTANHINVLNSMF